MADRQLLVHLIIMGFKVLPNEIPFLVLYSETLGKQQNDWHHFANYVCAIVINCSKPNSTPRQAYTQSIHLVL